jgi:putative transposase
MPRTNRIAPGGWVFHVLNRGNARDEIFEDVGDYLAFEAVLRETAERFRMRLLAYCLMPNHWHLVLWPREDGDLGRFMQRLTTTHVRRWHLHRRSVGHGHLYQGLYKSFPIQQDEHFLTVCRYVERNALRAKLVKHAEDWRWSSLAVRRMTPAQAERENAPALADWPVDPPRQWLRVVNEPQSDAELEALRRAVQRGRPFGGATWEKQAATRLGLQSTFRPRGRPRKAAER